MRHAFHFPFLSALFFLSSCTHDMQGGIDGGGGSCVSFLVGRDFYIKIKRTQNQTENFSTTFLQRKIYYIVSEATFSSFSSAVAEIYWQEARFNGIFGFCLFCRHSNKRFLSYYLYIPNLPGTEKINSELANYLPVISVHCVSMINRLAATDTFGYTIIWSV